MGRMKHNENCGVETELFPAREQNEAVKTVEKRAHKLEMQFLGMKQCSVPSICEHRPILRIVVIVCTSFPICIVCNKIHGFRAIFEIFFEFTQSSKERQQSSNLCARGIWKCPKRLKTQNRKITRSQIQFDSQVKCAISISCMIHIKITILVE